MPRVTQLGKGYCRTGPGVLPWPSPPNSWWLGRPAALGAPRGFGNWADPPSLASPEGRSPCSQARIPNNPAPGFCVRRWRDCPGRDKSTAWGEHAKHLGQRGVPMEMEGALTHPEGCLQGPRPACTLRQKPALGFSPLPSSVPSVPPVNPQDFSLGPPARHEFLK